MSVLTDSQEARKYNALAKDIDGLTEKYGLTMEKDRDIVLKLIDAQFEVIREAMRLEDLVKETM